MNDSCREHLLTNDERSHFEEQGFLIVRSALNESELLKLEEATDRIWKRELERDLGPQQNLFYPNFVGSEQVFIDLLDHPRVFPKVWGILNSWNIYLYHSHLGVTPQEAGAQAPFKEPLGFHQDSGRVNSELEGDPRPRLSLKVAYWLSDISEIGRGNFYIVPGSHLNNKLHRPANENPQGAIPVCVERGDAVFFDRRLWHARSPNHSPIVRKALFYGYAYRWLRTKDDMTIDPDLFSSCDPVRKQLLGYGSNCNGFFSPKDEDVPLKLRLEEHLGEGVFS
jgi:ectoine hydroxylase-related dioxygenase (phytanoyl-CoA dioxygenase family)